MGFVGEELNGGVGFMGCIRERLKNFFEFL